FLPCFCSIFLLIFVFSFFFFFFFFIDTSTTAISTLSLHDALPIFLILSFVSIPSASMLEIDDYLAGRILSFVLFFIGISAWILGDRKSTRLNSSHRTISYAVFCLKKKKEQ